MSLIDKLAEQKISEALKKGELDDLPGQGKPLRLDDDAMVPETLRTGYRMLKNAGYLPLEMQLRKEISCVESLIVQARSQETRDQLSKRLQHLLMQLSFTGSTSSLITEQDYFEKLQRKKND